MVWFWSKSPQTLSECIHTDFLVLQDQDTKVADARLVPNIRAYMAFREDVLAMDEKDEFYDEDYIKAAREFLYDFVTHLEYLLDEFHQDLTEHYLKFLNENRQEKQPSQKYSHYGFQTIEAVDMENPANFEFVTDHQGFERDYTLNRKPVVLKNVKLAESHNFTLDYLAEKCDFINVNDDAKISRHVENNEDVPTLDEWGGLEQYELPAEFMRMGQHRPGQAIKFEKFAKLASRFDNLYLHDHYMLN